MAKFIKNNSGGSKTWVGQVVADTAYYEIQSIEQSSWANNSALLTDIGSGDAIVATDDSGSNDITDVATAINHLKDANPIQIDANTPVRSFALSEGGTLRARLKGFINQTVTKNQLTNIDWLIPQTAYLGTNKQSYMDGIEYLADKAVAGDYMKFQIVDVDNILGYGAGFVADEFGDDWGVMPNTPTTIRLYKAKLIPGLYIRIKYTSTGTTDDVTFVANLFRHMDTSVNS